MSQHDHDTDRFDANIERLAQRIDPHLSLPEDAATSILTNLTSADQKPRRSLSRTAKALLGAAAAAILVLGAVLLLPTPNGSVAWAEVVQQMTEATSLRCWVTAETYSDGERLDHPGSGSKVIIKDPGRVRVDQYYHGEETGEPDFTAIDLTGVGGDDPGVSFSIQGTRWLRKSTTDSSCELRRYSTYQAAMLQRVIESARGARRHRIGRRTIDGAPTVGFESKLDKDIFGNTMFLSVRQLEWIGRVWVAVDSALPIVMELEGGDRYEGEYRRLVFEAMEWNVPIDDSLFSPPPVDDFEHFERSRSVCFTRQQLATDVSFALLSRDGSRPLIDRADITAIPRGYAQWQPREPSEPVRRFIDLEVTSGAEETVRSLEEHADSAKPMVWFEGVELGAFAPDVYGDPDIPPFIILDISNLDITLEEFEERYLVE